MVRWLGAAAGERRTIRGTPVTHGEWTVTPEWQIVTRRWPGGFLRVYRPKGVSVENGERSDYVQIVDVTRLLTRVMALAAMAALAAVMTVRVVLVRRKEQ